MANSTTDQRIILAKVMVQIMGFCALTNKIEARLKAVALECRVRHGRKVKDDLLDKRRARANVV